MTGGKAGLRCGKICANIGNVNGAIAVSRNVHGKTPFLALVRNTIPMMRKRTHATLVKMLWECISFIGG